MRALIRSLRYVSPHWPGTIAALGLMLVGYWLGIVKQWPQALLLDLVFQQDPAKSVQPALALWVRSFPVGTAVLGLALSFLVVHLVSAGLQWWHSAWFVRIGLQMLLRLRAEVYGWLQELSLKYHDTRRSSDSTFRVTYDTQSIQTIYNRGLVGTTGSVVQLLLALGAMLGCSVKLTLVALPVLAPWLWAVRYFAERVRRQTLEVQQQETDVLARVQEGLGSVRVVQAFGRQTAEVNAFREEIEESASRNLRLFTTNILSSFTVGTLTAAGTALFLWVAAQEAMAGRLTIGTFTIFLSYVAMMYQPLDALSYTGWALAGACAGMERVFEVLDAANDVADRPGAREITRTRGHITIRDAEFSYEPGHPILRGVSLDIEPGQTVAFVGGTGAGKSTLLSLVPRFYDCTAGSVALDGMDVRDITKASLRAQMAMVLQDTVLLASTVRENIAYGRLGATEEQIIAAAKAAQAHEFILQLPRGYDTQVGERGARLSGGQRQRIGIARAFLKDTPVLLLDEPTSALDPSTESEIMDAIEQLMAGRTTLIVTHRLQTIHNVDRIYVLDQGRIAETGTGPELLARGGLYARLWEDAQAGSS